MTDSYCVLDLETTGLDPKRDRIIEIGAVRIRNGVITDTFRSFVNPARKLEDRIVALTGIRDTDLADAPYIEDVLDDLLAFLGDDVLVGHSVLFDFSFVKRAAVNRHRVFAKQAIDTLKISRKYLQALPSRALGALCEHYGIHYRPHRALDDAIATHELLQRLKQEFETGETAADFEPSELVYQVKRESPASPRQIERLHRVAGEHGVALSMDPTHMTRNEVSRLTDLILNGSLRAENPDDVQSCPSSGNEG